MQEYGGDAGGGGVFKVKLGPDKNFLPAPIPDPFHFALCLKEPDGNSLSDEEMKELRDDINEKRKSRRNSNVFWEEKADQWYGRNYDSGYIACRMWRT